MSKREEKATDATKKVAEEAKRVEDKLEAAETLQEIGQQVTVNKIQESINTSLNETKKNVRKSIDETRSQIPRYTSAVKNYQEQALDSTGKMVEDYVEAEKSVINSVFESTHPYYENVKRIYDYWFSLRVPAEIWARSVSNIAENVLASARISNDMLFGNINAFGNALERLQQHTEELSRINVNNAKTIANTARETAAEFSVNTQKEVYR